MEKKETKQLVLMETTPRKLVTLVNALGDVVRNYDLDAYNERMIQVRNEMARNATEVAKSFRESKSL